MSGELTFEDGLHLLKEDLVEGEEHTVQIPLTLAFDDCSFEVRNDLGFRFEVLDEGFEVSLVDHHWELCPLSVRRGLSIEWFLG